jgi:hypothetical protein
VEEEDPIRTPKPGAGGGVAPGPPLPDNKTISDSCGAGASWPKTAKSRPLRRISEIRITLMGKRRFGVLVWRPSAKEVISRSIRLKLLERYVIFTSLFYISFKKSLSAAVAPLRKRLNYNLV